MTGRRSRSFPPSVRMLIGREMTRAQRGHHGLPGVRRRHQHQGLAHLGDGRVPGRSAPQAGPHHGGQVHDQLRVLDGQVVDLHGVPHEDPEDVRQRAQAVLPRSLAVLAVFSFPSPPLSLLGTSSTFSLRILSYLRALLFHSLALLI